jgi:choline dehydrogenase-like flavoprotein
MRGPTLDRITRHTNADTANSRNKEARGLPIDARVVCRWQGSAIRLVSAFSGFSVAPELRPLDESASRSLFASRDGPAPTTRTGSRKAILGMLIDARSVTADAEFACDLCVVGAGPAGIAIVDRLRESGLSIVLLESGGFDPEVATQRLYRGENLGHDYYRLDTCRFRLFGGTTNRWGGWCRPLDAVDFERRDWVPWSGWPIREGTLKPYYADAARLFELSDSRFEMPAWQDRLPAPFSLEGSNFENVVFQYSPKTNFGETYRARLVAAPNVTTLLHANLTQMELSADSSRVGLLRVAALTGRKCSIRPRAVVLAAGGIENARLLLASKYDRPAGLGNEFDLVGRFFMEHLHVFAGHLLAAGDRPFYHRARYDGAEAKGAITPTAVALERHRLLTTSIAIEAASSSLGKHLLSRPTPFTYGAIRLFRKARAGPLASFVETFRRSVKNAALLPTRYRTWNMAREARARAMSLPGSDRIYSLFFRAEQAPDPASRAALSERRDALGVPEIQLDWRVNPVDIASITGWLDVLNQDMRARGLGQVISRPEGWQTEISGGPHHMGTTRMSADSRHGVVDEHCRVHSVDNLYVAGSSVFATGGYANPTFTLVALALRLADTLRNRLRIAC